MRNKVFSWFLSIPITVQLLLLLLLVMVPSTGVVINSALNKRTEIINHTRAEIRKQADFIADNQQDIVFSAQQIGSALAKLPDVQKHNILPLQPILADRIKTNRIFSGIVIADKSGKVTISYPRQDNLRSIANRRSFRNAKVSRLFSTGEYNAENASDTTFISYSYPLTAADGTFNGVIDIEISRNIFQIILKDAIVPTGSNLIIVDHQGVVLYSQLYPQLIGKRDQSEYSAMMQRGLEDSGYFKGQGNDDIVRLTCFRKSRLEHEETPYMLTRVGKPYNSIIEGGNRELLLNTLSLCAITFVSFLFAWLLSKYLIIDRIKRLNTASQALAENNLDVSIPATEGSELGQLAKTFNHMVAQLRDREKSHLLYAEELRFNESKFEALYNLSLMADDTDAAILSFALEEGIRLTKSSIGYLCLMNDDESVMKVSVWSKEVMQECRISDRPFEFNVANSGLWGEAVRQRRAVITNDYAAHNPLKKGYPEGHLRLTRHMNVPLIVDGRIVLIFGVGNSTNDYADKETLMLTLIMDGLWKIREKKRAIEERLENERILDTLLNADFESICLLTSDYHIVKANQTFAHRLNNTPETMYGKPVLDFFPPEISASRKLKYDEAVATQKPVTFEDRRGAIDFINSVNPVIDVSGAVAYLAFYSMDVTRLKQFENEVITANSKLKALNQNIEDAREEEKQTLARELHDQMGQTLTGLSLDMNWLMTQLDQQIVQKLNSHIVGMHITVETLIAMVQGITARLSPPLLDNLGLAEAIGYYVHDFERKSGIACHLMLDEDASNCLAKEETIAIFRILQESLTNVVRHADAHEVAVSLCLTPQAVILEVADNGKGATHEAISAPDAFGVLGMQERAGKCGGSLSIQENPGGGTIVRMEIPQRI